MIRGDLVIVDFRATAPQAGVRPALVIQNDRDNARMSNVYTIDQRDVARVIGSISTETVQSIDECIKIALGLT